MQLKQVIGRIIRFFVKQFNKKFDKTKWCGVGCHTAEEG
jgi:hypothetical protein